MGMTPNSLKLLLAALPRIGLSKNYQLYDGVIDEFLRDDLVQSFPGLRFRTFATQDALCRLLHGAIRKALGLAIQPLY